MNSTHQKLGFRHSVRRAVRLGLAFPLVACLAACGGTSDTPMCSATTTPQAADKFCAPSSVAAGQPLKLQLREQCGGCTHHATKCDVVVSGSDIKLQLLGEECVVSPQTSCAAFCAISTLDCAVPALVAGTYRVTTPAGTTTVTMMTAGTTSAVTSCTVTTP